MARFNQFEEGKKYYNAQPNPAQDVANIADKFLGGAVTRKAVESVGSAMDRQQTALQSMRDSEKRATWAREPQQQNIATDIPQQPDRATWARDSQPATSTPASSGKRVYTNINGGLGVGSDMQGVRVNRGRGAVRPQQGNSPYEVTNSSWTPEESERFNRNPTKPAPNQRIKAGRPEGGWSSDYKKSWNQQGETAPKFTAPGQSGSAAKATIARKTDRWNRDQQKFSETENLKAITEEGATEREIMRGQTQLGAIAAQGENQAKYQDTMNTNLTEQLDVENQNKIAAQEKQNIFSTERSDIDNQRNIEESNRNKALTAYQGGLDPNVANQIQSGGEFGPDYGKFSQVNKKQKESLTQSDASKGLQEMRKGFHEWQIGNPVGGDGAGDQSSAFDRYMSMFPGMQDQFNMFNSTLGIGRGDTEMQRLMGQ